MLHRVLVVAVVAGAALSCAGGGTSDGQKLEDMEFLALVDPVTDVEPRLIRLSDYFAENRPGTRIIMLNAAAGWCAPCLREATALPELAATYGPQGVAILSAVFQDQNGDPADAEFVRTWAQSCQLTVPALIDSTFQTGIYFDVNTMPANMFVDAETLDILAIATGAATGDDPLKDYRDLLDYYLQ